MNHAPQLSRRETQIMDILHARGQATAAEVLAALPDAPGYSAVRALLRILEEKGHARHHREGARYVYAPCTSPEKARRSALQRVVATFFQGSVAQTMAALLDGREKISKEELQRLESIIQQAKNANRNTP